jgi:hypothetical protein
MASFSQPEGFVNSSKKQPVLQVQTINSKLLLPEVK